MVDILTTLCALLALKLPQIAARTYDVEAEAQRLYGEDLSSVIRKFRRSPDYKLLLNNKVKELLASFDMVYTKVYSTTLKGPLKDRIEEICGVSKNQSLFARSYSDLGAMHDTKRMYGRNVTQNPFLALDQYVHDQGLLSTHEKHHIRDIAFEMAGNAIHMIITVMGPVDAEGFSTRQPYGGDAGPVKTTLAKDHHHTITSSSFNPNMDMHSTAKRPSVEVESPIDKTLRVYNLQKT